MDKEKSTKRIDGAVTTIMALGQTIQDKDSIDNVYN